MALTLSGVTIGQIGDQYDLAVGFSTDGTTAKMVGYCRVLNTEWQESTDINDSQRLIQIASPNSTDRFTFYPKVSQGDWSGGEGQVFFVDPTKYYATSGLIDATNPGYLQLLPSRVTTTLAHDGTTTDGVAASTGNALYVTHGTTGTLKIAIGLLTTGNPFPMTDHNAAVNFIWDMIPRTNADSVIAMSSGGLYEINSAGVFTQWSNDGATGKLGGSMMVEFGGNVYYAAGGNGTQIRHVPDGGVGAANGTTDVTVPTFEGTIMCVGLAAQGVFYVVGDNNNSNWNQGDIPSTLYTFDGATTTRIGTVNGRVPSIVYANGVTYFVVVGLQKYNQIQPLLYAYSGGTVTVIDDFRSATSDFQSTQRVTDYDFFQVQFSRLTTDDRYVYLPWLGTRAYAYNTSTGARYELGTLDVVSSPTNTYTHFWVPSRCGSIEVTSIGTTYGGATISAHCYNGNGTFGAPATLTTSYFDFGAPTTFKVFRDLEIELVNPLSGGQSVGVSYRLDNASAFTTLSVLTTGPNNLQALFPSGTKGFRVQFQLTLTPGTTSPIIRSYSVNARLGRVWKGTLSCMKDQQTLDGHADSQGVDSQGLISALVNAYTQAAGSVVLFVPSPTQSTGTEQVNAVLEEYTYRSVRSGPYQTDQSSRMMEGEIDVTFVEAL